MSFQMGSKEGVASSWLYQAHGAGLAISSVGALGFGFAGDTLAASVRPFKRTATTGTRNTCTYCSVACGILIYSLYDRARGVMAGRVPAIPVVLQDTEARGRP